MQTLFEFCHDQDHYLIKGNNFGKEQVWRNGVLVSEGRALLSHSYDHRFLCPKHGPVRLHFKLVIRNNQVHYWLKTPETLLCEGETVARPPAWLHKLESKLSSAEKVSAQAEQTSALNEQIEVKQSTTPSLLKKGFKPFFVIGLVLVKLSKSAGAIKAALAGTSLAGWAWLFNLEVAVGLIAALIIHEYGHVYAMKRSGLKVKGVYLLPFVGGVAISERSTSRWQDFKIAIAGPAFGTLGAVIAYGLWLETQHTALASFATISLLLNLFNLLPMVPLDGGRVIQAAVYSRNGKAAKLALLFFTGSLSFAAWYFGFYLLMLFGLLGTLDLWFEADEQAKNVLPMSNTGILITIVSYLCLLAVLLWLSTIMADSGIPGTNLPLIFISS
ncbi:M50 family metallopeptidase [Alishewanella sp. 16-MA]|uniref:M50 family metallopeptidase n=1 Tax=Alishewanella maricola TaxID=2795740 RepID=A0ABS8C498_9ALTE|nr:site-2 protease family protein [Alishewanella maricola]MCB5227142.1 M50 family metallopeptidase [Alishewanella maricola]